MSWIKIDDQFPDHPKLVLAGARGGWLYVCGLCYCGRYLTDGAIPAVQIRKLTEFDDNEALAAVLVEVGLWERRGETYIVHDYHEYNPTREQVLRERAATKARQDRFRGAPAPAPARNVAPVLRAVPPPTKRATKAPKAKRGPEWAGLWEALTEGLGYAPSSANEKARHAKCVDQLAAMDPQPTPGDVLTVCRRYRQQWPKITISGEAILSNFSRFLYSNTNGDPATERARAVKDEALRMLRADRAGAPENGAIDVVYQVRSVGDG